MNFRPSLFVAVLAAVGGPAAESKSDDADRAELPAEVLVLGKEAGQVRDDNGLKMKFVWCPSGNFTMGSPESEMDHGKNENQVGVALTRGFWLGKYEVTQSEYERVIGQNPSGFSANGNLKERVVGTETKNFPVERVNYDDALEYCRKLTEKERTAGRLPNDWEYTLPTEAQWEYACRAETNTPFAFGMECNGRQANCKGHEPYGTDSKGPSLGRTIQVGSYAPNAWGLCDMHGNVWEWCRDAYERNLPGGTDPEVLSRRTEKPGDRADRIIRGGDSSSPAKNCRSASRSRLDAVLTRASAIGFRVALVPTWKVP